MEGNRNWGEDYFRHKQTNKQTTILEPNENISFLHQGIIFMSFVFYYIPLMAAFYGLYHMRTFSQSLSLLCASTGRKAGVRDQLGDGNFTKEGISAAHPRSRFLGSGGSCKLFQPHDRRGLEKPINSVVIPFPQGAHGATPSMFCTSSTHPTASQTSGELFHPKIN